MFLWRLVSLDNRIIKGDINGYLQVYDSILCGYFCIGFIDFTDFVSSKRLVDFANLFSLNSFRNNDKIILKYFQLFNNV